MTDNTEPTIDTILQTLCDYVYNAGELAKHQGIFVGGEPKREALEAIERIISDQVARARIEELEHIISGSEYSADDFDWYEITRAEYTGTKYYSEVRHLTKEERIAELEATLNGVKNK